MKLKKGQKSVNLYIPDLQQVFPSWIVSDLKDLCEVDGYTAIFTYDTDTLLKFFSKYHETFIEGEYGFVDSDEFGGLQRKGFIPAFSIEEKEITTNIALGDVQVKFFDCQFNKIKVCVDSQHNAEMSNCDFNSCKIDASLKGHLRKTSFNEVTFDLHFRFVDCNLSKISFKSCANIIEENANNPYDAFVMVNVTSERLVFFETTISNADFRNSSLEFKEFERSCFKNAIFEDCKFVFPHNASGLFEDCKFKNCEFTIYDEDGGFGLSSKSIHFIPKMDGFRPKELIFKNCK